MINLMHGVPLPPEIIATRQFAKITQTAAADSVGVSRRTWQSWESGLARMPFATWALFLLETGQHGGYVLQRRQGPLIQPKMTKAPAAKKAAGA